MSPQGQPTIDFPLLCAFIPQTWRALSTHFVLGLPQGPGNTGVRPDGYGWTHAHHMVMSPKPFPVEGTVRVSPCDGERPKPRSP